LALLSILRETQDAMNDELADVADSSVAKVQGSSEDPFLFGTTRGSVRKEENEFGFALTSDLPQAGVWNFGGTIEPRGVPIEIPRTEFVVKPVEDLGADIDERIADRFDNIAHRHGFL
jgi:hypothetical protein